MTGPMGEMSSLLKQAQQMQKDLDRARAELRELVVEGRAEGGAVAVTMSGDRQIKSVQIAPETLAARDKAALEGLVLEAVRDALARAQQAAEERMGRVTGGVQVPGFF